MRKELDKRKQNTSLLAHSSYRGDEGTSPIDDKLHLNRFSGLIDM